MVRKTTTIKVKLPKRRNLIALDAKWRRAAVFQDKKKKAQKNACRGRVRI